MSKPYYETEEYSEAENELDTYDDPVKLVMEYRVSEKHKDNKISDLEAKLADIEESAVAVIDANFKIAEENQQLKQSQKQLAISELVKIKRYIDDNAYYIDEINFGEEINEYIDNQIKELGGEKNE